MGGGDGSIKHKLRRSRVEGREMGRVFRYREFVAFPGNVGSLLPRAIPLMTISVICRKSLH